MWGREQTFNVSLLSSQDNTTTKFNHVSFFMWIRYAITLFGSHLLINSFLVFYLNLVISVNTVSLNQFNIWVLFFLNVQAHGIIMFLCLRKQLFWRLLGDNFLTNTFLTYLHFVRYLIRICQLTDRNNKKLLLKLSIKYSLNNF